MVVYGWQMAQDRRFFCLLEDTRHKKSWNFKEMRALMNVRGIQVTALSTNCIAIVEELAICIKDREAPSISFAVSLLRGLRRAQEEIIGATDSVEAGPTAEEEC